MKSAPKDYRPGNLEAARIILETPGVYGAGMVEWARRVRGEWLEPGPSQVPIEEPSLVTLEVRPCGDLKELHFHPDCFAVVWPKLGGDPQVEETS